MHDKHSLPAMLDKLYENQLALAAAIEELALWIEVRADDADVAGNVRSALDTLDRNADFINETIGQLRTELVLQHQAERVGAPDAPLLP
ncbi:hypothetical protein [Pseudomonas sp. dw_358]|uniref:hypothetical protein n=1 Tax=Pseudomonas sp. dw_358 TaxID=2720083 RepID=UPI002116CA50|nr:hypothetical protein [Pseudomonas sp. dw_358]